VVVVVVTVVHSKEKCILQLVLLVENLQLFPLDQVGISQYIVKTVINHAETAGKH